MENPHGPHGRRCGTVFSPFARSVSALRCYLAFGVNKALLFLSLKAATASWPSLEMSQFTNAMASLCFTVLNFSGFMAMTPYWLNKVGSPSRTRAMSSLSLSLAASQVPRSVRVYARFSSAMRWVFSIPCPTSRYHFRPTGSLPAFFQRESSLVWVPDLSPRETNRDPDSAIFLNASAADLMPLIFAGSEDGPMMTKSLYITS